MLMAYESKVPVAAEEPTQVKYDHVESGFKIIYQTNASSRLNVIDY